LDSAARSRLLERWAVSALGPVVLALAVSGPPQAAALGQQVRLRGEWVQLRAEWVRLQALPPLRPGRLPTLPLVLRAPPRERQRAPRVRLQALPPVRRVRPQGLLPALRERQQAPQVPPLLRRDCS
jgi:hypothetical protein